MAGNFCTAKLLLAKFPSGRYKAPLLFIRCPGGNLMSLWAAKNSARRERWGTHLACAVGSNVKR
jgi:hypothetical protein